MSSTHQHQDDNNNDNNDNNDNVKQGMDLLLAASVADSGKHGNGGKKSKAGGHRRYRLTLCVGRVRRVMPVATTHPRQQAAVGAKRIRNESFLLVYAASLCF